MLSDGGVRDSRTPDCFKPHILMCTLGTTPLRLRLRGAHRARSGDRALVGGGDGASEGGLSHVHSLGREVEASEENGTRAGDVMTLGHTGRYDGTQGAH